MIPRELDLTVNKYLSTDVKSKWERFLDTHKPGTVPWETNEDPYQAYRLGFFNRYKKRSKRNLPYQTVYSSNVNTSIQTTITATSTNRIVLNHGAESTIYINQSIYDNAVYEYMDSTSTSSQIICITYKDVDNPNVDELSIFPKSKPMEIPKKNRCNQCEETPLAKTCPWGDDKCMHCYNIIGKQNSKKYMLYRFPWELKTDLLITSNESYDDEIRFPWDSEDSKQLEDRMFSFKRRFLNHTNQKRRIPWDVDSDDITTIERINSDIRISLTGNFIRSPIAEHTTSIRDLSESNDVTHDVVFIENDDSLNTGLIATY